MRNGRKIARSPSSRVKTNADRPVLVRWLVAKREEA